MAVRLTTWRQLGAIDVSVFIRAHAGHDEPFQGHYLFDEATIVVPCYPCGVYWIGTAHASGDVFRREE